MSGAGVDVIDWLAQRPGSSMIAVLVAPTGEAGKFQTCSIGTTGAPETLIATIAMLDDLAGLVRGLLDVEGSPQMLARVEHCRRLLLSELAQ